MWLYDILATRNMLLIHAVRLNTATECTRLARAHPCGRPLRSEREVRAALQLRDVEVEGPGLREGRRPLGAVARRQPAEIIEACGKAVVP